MSCPQLDNAIVVTSLISSVHMEHSILVAAAILILFGKPVLVGEVMGG